MIQAKVLGSEIDQNGNIKVATEYTLTDGSKVIGHTRYAYWNYSREKILEDINQHCETLVARIYQVLQEERINRKQRNIDLMNEVKIDDLIAQSNSTEIECNEIKDVKGVILQEAKRILFSVDKDGKIKEQVLREGKPPIENIEPL